MEAIKTFKEKKGKTVFEIYQDEDPESPRSWDNLGKMVCFHKRYSLGDKTNLNEDNFNSWDELKEYLVKEERAVLILPVYLYDHSGLRMKVGSFNGLLPQGHAYFDSGQVGFIYVDAETLKKEKVSKKKAEKILQGEIETYDQYLSGDVYGYRVYKVKKCKCCENESEDFIDSCSGFYGLDEKSIFESAGLKQEDFQEVK